MDKLLVIVVILFHLSAFGQDEERRNLYYGNVQYDKENYAEAIEYYQEAIAHNPLSFKPYYNMGNAYFRNQDFEKATDMYASIVDLAPTDFEKSKVYHNLGNAQLFNQKLDDAIDSYKSALRLNPKDEETRYNLAYALQMKKEQEKQNPEKNQNNENQDNENDKQNSDDNEKQDSENNENQNSDQNNDEKNSDKNDDTKNEQNSDGNKPDQKNGENKAQPTKISKEQAKRILDAAYKREKEIQNQIEKQKVVGTGTSSKKDW